MSQGVEKLDRATASQDLLNTLAKASVDETEDLVELYGQLYDIATKFGTEEMVYLPKAAEDLYDIEKLYDVFLLKHKEALDTLENSKSAYNTVENTISDLSQMMSEGMQGVGEDFGQGYEKGILSKVKEVEDAAEDIGKSGIESLRKAQDPNSPSKETMKLGEDFVEGYNKGINDNIFSTQNVVSNYISQIAKKFSGLIPLLFNVGKSSMSSFLDGIISMENRLYQKLNDITRNISSAMANISSGMAASSGGALNTGFSMYGIENVPTISSEIPRLATGAVIPANREFLAVLGNQKHGTNIEAPLDTIRQANEEVILNVFSKLGISAGNNRSSGNETYVFQVDGETFFRIMRKHAQEYFNSTGNSAFPI
ncbi:MAG: hypothetical protein K2J60_07935 [Acetatifactor sp.]|nr:hypothetical protein [Acetatifactor sp.]